MNSATMTKREVAKRMAAAGIAGETGSGRAWEVELADEATMEAFCRDVIPTGGYRTGYGGWVLRPGYKIGDCDYSNPASRMHY